MIRGGMIALASFAVIMAILAFTGAEDTGTALIALAAAAVLALAAAVSVLCDLAEDIGEWRERQRP